MVHPLTAFYNFVAALNFIWDWVWDKLNTNFSAALFGALLGAYGAHWIANRQQRRYELINEINNTNAALSIAHIICVSYLGSKSQHVRNLKTSYDRHVAEFNEFSDRRKTGQLAKGEIFHLKADLELLPRIETPVDLLMEYLFQKLSPGKRTLGLVQLLRQTAKGLAESVDQRNQLITNHKAQRAGNGDRLLAMYFGLPTKEGTDLSYPTIIKATYQQTDDCIFFSKEICLELMSHSLSIAGANKWLPKPNKVEFKVAIEKGLMPDDKEYIELMKMFAD